MSLLVLWVGEERGFWLGLGGFLTTEVGIVELWVDLERKEKDGKDCKISRNQNSDAPSFVDSEFRFEFNCSFRHSILVRGVLKE